ncbi:MAG: putative acetyltransferase [Hyphomicrobiales bacterium]|jgi:putative acetyltransferase|nr:putative acetyltransferase [Hyphomicrobiales bacterium]
MNDTFTIRPEPPDQPDVVRLIAALDTLMTSLYPAESNHFLDMAALSDPAVTFLVVRDSREVIGCGAILRDPRGWGEIKRMVVRPDQRGRGIGARVLSELEGIARTAGLSLLRLETGIHNTDALALYRRAGFAERGPFGDYAPDPLSVFMEKRVSI